MELDPFESPRVLLTRANEHIEEMRKRESAFFNSQPYTRFVEKDPKTGWDSHKLRLAKKIPSHITAVYSDALNSLRHALDHAMCASVRVVTEKPDVKNVYFPFADDAAQFEIAIKSKCRGVAPEVIDYVRTLKPYGGQHSPSLLRALNKLAGTNKHQMLMPMFANSPGVVSVRSFENLGRDGMPLGIWDGEKNELTLMLIRPGAKPNYSLDFRFHIGLGENSAKLGGPAANLAALMGQEVSGVLWGIEQATIRALATRP